MNNLLINLAIAYQGDYDKIIYAIEHHIKPQDYPKQDAITILDDCYPKEFLQLRQPPLVLFYKGNFELLKTNKVAVVGSRRMTDYGERATIDVVEMLKDDYCIVSGMAKGIDGCSHKHANKSIAILGNGIDVIYPKENEELYQYMADLQLIISEYPSKVKPDKKHFPFRNRLIAALSQKIIVTQAAIHSGTMLTVNEALELNKEIYCIPYPYDDVNGAGCNYLIQQGANVITKENMKYLFDK